MLEAALDSRYAIVEPGDRCWICTLPVLSRQFVFPCQHAFHSDCLGKRVLDNSNLGKKKHIKDLQVEVSRGLSVGPQREKLVRELDGLMVEQCVLCGDLGIKAIDEPGTKAWSRRKRQRKPGRPNKLITKHDLNSCSSPAVSCNLEEGDTHTMRPPCPICPRRASQDIAYLSPYASLIPSS